MRKWAALLGCILLALAIVCVLVLLPGTWLPPTDEAAPADGHEEPANETETRLAGRGRAQGEAPDPDAVGADPTTTLDASGAHRVLLEGRVEIEGAPTFPALEKAVHVLVFLLPDSTSGSLADFAGAEATKYGSFRVDVTHVVEGISSRRRQPEIIVAPDHADYVGARVRIPLDDIEGLLAGTTTLETVTLVLRRAGHVEGVVLDISGSPRPDARVMLYTLHGGIPQRIPVSFGRTSKDGSFRLSGGRSARHLLVAAWEDFDGPTGVMRQRPLPAHAYVDLVVAETAEDVELRLQRSFAIRGTVRRRGVGAGWADVGWKVQAAEHRLSIDLSGHWSAPLVWAHGRAHWGPYNVRSGKGGAFEILGLSAIPYGIYVTDMLGMHVHRMSWEASSLTCTPPASDVVLDLTPAHLVVRFTVNGRPVSLEDKVGMAAIGSGPDSTDTVCWRSSFGETDAQGRFDVDLTPGYRYELWVEESGFQSVSRELKAPAAGETLEIEVGLEPERTGPSLVVTLEGEGFEATEIAGFGLYEPGVDPRSRTPYPVCNVRPEEGRYVLEDLIPGTFHLHVRAGRTWNSRPNDYLDAVQEVVIPAEGEARVRVTVRKGGRLQISATDESGRHLDVTCKLHDPHGQSVTARFIAKQGGADMTVCAVGGFPGVGPFWAMQALAEGAWRVVLESEGYEREERRVDVRAGKPVLLQVTMRPVPR